MAKPEEKAPMKGAMKDRWSLLSLLKTIGLSKELIGGEEPYKKLIAKANEGAGEFHSILKMRLESKFGTSSLADKFS